MVETITQDKEVLIGSTVFPIVGRVQRSKASGYPSKIVIGDYTYDDEPLLSTWIMNDQRGGILVEEMDESIHADRCWWSNLILNHKGSITLPRLATQISKIDDIITPTGFVDGSSAWSNEANAYDGDTSTTATCSVPTESWSGYLELTHASLSCRAIRFYIDGYSEGIINLVDIDAYYNSQWNNVYQGVFSNDTWTIKALASTQDVTSVRFRFYNDHGINPSTAKIKEVEFIQEDETGGTIRCAANFNGNLYFGVDDTLQKLNGAGDALQLASADAIFTSNLTELTSSIGSCLYIYLNGSESYWVMSTSEGLTEVDFNDYSDWAASTAYTVGTYAVPTTRNNRIYECTTAGTSDGSEPSWTTGEGDTISDNTVTWTCRLLGDVIGVNWDSKLHKCDTMGNFAQSTDPNASSPTWTAKGDLAKVGLADGEIHGFLVYFDSDGEQIIYASTKHGLFAHDAAGSRFIETAVSLPQHSNAGKGHTVWHDAAWVSSGLVVRKFIAGNTAVVTERGLDLDDGLPEEYQGEITSLIEGDREVFALVDANEAAGTNYSGLYAFNDIGWQCWWASSTANTAMKTSIISNADGTRKIYWDDNNKLYTINLQTSQIKPKQISTFTYAASGIHITPWFDAGTVHDKLAARYKIELQDITADETVVIKYRINHANTDRDTGWTTLATINATELGAAYGEKEYTFASNAGLEFRSIQFRYDLARGSTTTKSPVIVKAALSFQKILPIKWGFDFVVDCSSGYRESSPAQLVATLDTLVETATLSEFTYKDDSAGDHTYYVHLINAQALEETGWDYRGQYRVSLVEL